MVDTYWRGFISSGRAFSNSTLNRRYAVIGMTKRQPAIILNNPRPRTHWGILPRTLMLRLAVPENLCSSPELPFDLILLRTGQRGHFADVRFGRNAVGKHSLA